MFPSTLKYIEQPLSYCCNQHQHKPYKAKDFQSELLVGYIDCYIDSFLLTIIFLFMQNKPVGFPSESFINWCEH